MMVIPKINILIDSFRRIFLTLFFVIIFLNRATILASNGSEINKSKSPHNIVLTTTNVNLRSGPGINFPSKTIIPKGSQLKVISINNNWYEVTYLQKTGFVFKEYLIFSNSNSGAIQTRTTRDLFSMLITILLPLLWTFLLFNPSKPGYKLLTFRGHFFLASVFVIIPSIKFFALAYGESVFLSWQIIQILISIINIADLISIGALFIKSFKTMRLEVIITLILVFSLIVYGSQIGKVGGLCLSILSIGMTFDQILFEMLETKSINKPMDRYFTGFKYN